MLYARSDMMSVGIPVTSGGCGDTHSRPVKNGAPVKVWGLDCTQCESVLRGDKKQKIIHVTPGDKDKGIPARLVHVADTDPHWSATPEGIPLTPDEEHIHKLRAERGTQQLDMLQAYAALSKIPGLDLKDYAEAKWMLDQTLDPLRRPVVRGTLICPDGHENDSGARFCNECGSRMDAKAILQMGDPLGQEVDLTVLNPDKEMGNNASLRVDALPLRTLHVSTLRKMCREKGINDKGKKEDLITRLGG